MVVSTTPLHGSSKEYKAHKSRLKQIGLNVIVVPPAHNFLTSTYFADLGEPRVWPLKKTQDQPPVTAAGPFTIPRLQMQMSCATSTSQVEGRSLGEAVLRQEGMERLERRRLRKLQRDSVRPAAGLHKAVAAAVSAAGTGGSLLGSFGGLSNTRSNTNSPAQSFAVSSAAPPQLAIGDSSSKDGPQRRTSYTVPRGVDLVTSENRSRSSSSSSSTSNQVEGKLSSSSPTSTRRQNGSGGAVGSLSLLSDILKVGEEGQKREVTKREPRAKAPPLAAAPYPVQPAQTTLFTCLSLESLQEVAPTLAPSVVEHPSPKILRQNTLQPSLDELGSHERSLPTSPRPPTVRRFMNLKELFDYDCSIIDDYYAALPEHVKNPSSNLRDVGLFGNTTDPSANLLPITKERLTYEVYLLARHWAGCLLFDFHGGKPHEREKYRTMSQFSELICWGERTARRVVLTAASVFCSLDSHFEVMEQNAIAAAEIGKTLQIM